MNDFSSEIQFVFSRSGGKGGQNVNKVETAATGFWLVGNTRIFTPEQQLKIRERLSNRINGRDELLVRSDKHRSQGANKQEVVEKMQQLVAKALEPRKPRIATHLPSGVIEKRLQRKKQKSELKRNRQKVSF